MFKAKEFLAKLVEKKSHESEFLQAVMEVAESLEDFLNENPKYQDNKIMERIIEPERTIVFRVLWMDDNGEIQVNT